MCFLKMTYFPLENLGPEQNCWRSHLCHIHLEKKKVFMNLDNFAGKALTKRGLISCSSPRPQVGGDSCADRVLTASVNDFYYT